MLAHTLSKEERISSKKQIEFLFTNSKNIFQFPLKINYIVSDNNKKLNKILISVSKKNFKKAVDRNKIKRIIREGYRKNKNILIQSNNTFEIAFVYIHKQLISQQEMEKKIMLALHRIVNENK